MSIRGVLVDLSGVLYVGDKPLPGVAEALVRLAQSGLRVRYVTNTTRMAAPGIVAQLKAMGLAIPHEALLTVGAAARQYLLTHGLHPYLLVHPALKADFADMDMHAPDAVVLGDMGETLDYTAMNHAFRLLDRGAPLIALGRNRFFRDADGGLSLDQGPFVAALEYATGRPAEVIGKPASAFFAMILANMGCVAADTVMIGDDLEADIGGAQAAGVRGILVRTGKYRPSDEAHPDIHPWRICDDFVATVEMLRGIADQGLTTPS